MLLIPTSQKPGATEISYPDPLHPEYSRRLRAATARSDILDVRADVLTMCVPADNALKLTVSLRPVPSLSRPVPGSADQPRARGAATGSESVLVPPVVQWLREEAEKWEGYAAFKRGQNHVQTNANVVASWRFAVSFSEHHSRTVSPVQVPSGHGRRQKHKKLIRKGEVQQALGVGATWMSEATQAVALLCKYGEGGPSPRQHIIDMCSDQTAKVGARTLLSRLREEGQG